MSATVISAVERTDASLWFVQGSSRFQLFGDDLFKTLAEMAKAPQTELASFVRANGAPVPNGMPEDAVLFTAKSFLQLAWYQNVKNAVPENVRLNHEKRLADYTKLAEKIGANPPEARDKTPLPELPIERTQVTLGLINNVPGVIFPAADAGEAPQGVLMFLVRPYGLKRTIEDLRKRPDADLYRAILATAGYESPASHEAAVYYPVAAGIVQSWWYRFALANGVTDEEGKPVVEPVLVPDDLQPDLRRRYQRYQHALNPATVKPEKKPKEPKPPKEPKAPKLPKEPKEPKAPRPEGEARVVRKAGLIFGVTEGKESEKAALRAAAKQVYDAVVHARGDNGSPLEAVVAQAVAAGFTTKEPAGPAPRVRWLALELVKKGILYVVGEQLEVPGTPSPLPKE